jgi:hypothetical protein
VDAGLKVGIRRVGSDRVRKSRKEIDVFLLGMKNKNPNGDQQSVDGEGNHSRCSPKTRPERGRKHDFTFAAVEENSQRPGQHDAEQWDHLNENAEHAGHERGPNRSASVHRASARDLSRLRRGQPRLYRNLRRKLARRGIQAGHNPRFRNRYLHVDLRSVALRTERSTILDRRPTLLARVLHVFETSAQRTKRARQGKSHRVTRSSSYRVILTANAAAHPMLSSDGIVLARVHAHINQGKAGTPVIGLNGNDVLVTLGSHLQLHRV